MRCGRPRSFDREAALDAAMNVFWQYGYQGASMADLTAAMGINKPSLYAAFGDKAKLFLQALQRYMEQHIQPKIVAFNGATEPREALRELLKAMVKMTTDPEGPRGCLVVNSTRELDCCGLPEEISEALAQASGASVQFLRNRFQADQMAGRLAPHQDPLELARYFSAIIGGLAVMAKAGADCQTLDGVINTALRILDVPTTSAAPAPPG